jgi:hypothetical protein
VGRTLRERWKQVPRSARNDRKKGKDNGKGRSRVPEVMTEKRQGESFDAEGAKFAKFRDVEPWTAADFGRE